MFPILSPEVETFLTVSRAGSFTKAADALFITPTAVMKRIDKLEKGIGAELYRRFKTGVELTDAGELFFRSCEAMESDSLKALEKVRNAADAETKTIRLGNSILNSCEPFLPLWDAVSDRFPGWKLRIVPFEDDRNGILRKIRELGEKFDFIYGPCDSLIWLNRVNLIPVTSVRLEVAVARTHRLAKKTRVTFEDLAGETILMPLHGDSPRNDRLRNEFLKRGIRVIGNSPFYDLETFNRVTDGKTVLITLSCWKSIHPFLVTIPGEWSDAVPYGLITEIHPRPALLPVIDAIRTEAVRQRVRF